MFLLFVAVASFAEVSEVAVGNVGITFCCHTVQSPIIVMTSSSSSSSSYHHHFQRHRLDLCSDAKHCLHLFTSQQELMKTSGGKNLHDVDYSIMEYSPRPLSSCLILSLSSLVIYHFLSSCFRPFHLFLSPAYQTSRLNAWHSC